MNEELNRAFEQISDEHISEAVGYRKKRFPWIKSIAAVLAVVIAWTAIWAVLDFPPTIISPRPTVEGTDPADLPNPGGIQSPGTLRLANLVAAPQYPKMVSCPVYSAGGDHEAYSKALIEWHNSTYAQYNQPAGYADSLADFWAKSIPEFLSGEGNRAYSPVNVYLALAMLAETTGGNSRQEILNLLGADSIEALRTQAGHVWNAHYCDDGKTTSLLANSLWLDDAYGFKDEAVQNLVSNYFASIFNGDLGTEELNEQLRTWINSQTGGLLEEQTKKLELSADSVFALASTIYFAADWEGGFNAQNTADGVFHCDTHDLTTPFMNKTITIGTYYWGKDFGAVELPLSSGSMWLILPDEDTTVDAVLTGGEYLEMTTAPTYWENKKSIKINLSMPKFDISSQTNLIDGMKNLGLSDVFDPDHSDFSPMTDAEKLFVGKIDHAVRVAADEEGVIAAAYTVIQTYATGCPSIPDDEIDFVLDRPFLFVVSSRNALPLFAGVVEQP